MGSTVDTDSPPALPARTHAVVPSTFVVPLDGSDLSLRASPIAAWCAGRFGAEVIEVTPQMTGGDHDPVATMADVVAGHPNSCVCMSTHSRGNFGASTLGSVAQRVLREIGVPVLLVGPECTEDPFDTGPVVVGHDGSPAADAILGPARAWARGLGVPIVLVHVHHPLDVRTADHPDDVIGSALEFLGAGTRVEVVADAFPPGAIRDVAHELDASLIAMSTHGRRGVARIVMGSVTSWVTRESPCPVLTIRPEQLDG